MGDKYRKSDGVGEPVVGTVSSQVVTTVVLDRRLR